MSDKIILSFPQTGVVLAQKCFFRSPNIPACRLQLREAGVNVRVAVTSRLVVGISTTGLLDFYKLHWILEFKTSRGDRTRYIKPHFFARHFLSVPMPHSNPPTTHTYVYASLKLNWMVKALTEFIWSITYHRVYHTPWRERLWPQYLVISSTLVTIILMVRSNFDIKSIINT